MSLSLLKLDILGCEEKGAVPLVGQLIGELAGGYFRIVFLGVMAHVWLPAGALKWCKQKADL
jgi:hypothetical protein